MPRDYGTAVFRVNSLLQVRLPELKGVRDARGRFTSAQAEMVSRNREFAVKLQAEVVTLMEQRITRRGASTGRLLRATASPENAQYDVWRAGVGVESFLDSSIAKYWRTFEEGSAGLWKHPFVGTQLMPKGPGKPPYPVAHGAVPGIRTTRAQLKWMDGRRYVVKHEIAPRWAYRDAVRKVNPAQYAFQSATQLLRRVYGTDQPGGGYFA